MARRSVLAGSAGVAARHKRLMRLEQQAQGDTIVLSDTQTRLLERRRVKFRCRHLEASLPRELLNQHTFYWVTLKDFGKVYVRVVVDVFCSVAFAAVHTRKIPVTAADLLYDHVPPYEALGLKVGAILTDNGREFCGIRQRHPHRLLLAMKDIEHRNIKVRHPRTNRVVERMNRTLLDECFRAQRRQTWYVDPEEIQRDLDIFMRYYNLERTHQGYRLESRTPVHEPREALGITEIPDVIPVQEASEPLATAA